MKRRYLALAGLLALVALAAYATVTAVRFVAAYGEMVEGKRLLMSIEAGLRDEGLDASPHTLDQAGAQAESARDRFRSAQSFINGEPLLRAARWLPWAGSQVAATSDLAAIGVEASEVGLAGVAALRKADARRAEGEGPLGERAAALLADVRPEMAAVEASLAEIRERRDDIDGRWLLPPIAIGLADLDARLPELEETFDRYRWGDAVAAALLGFDRPMTYLVLGQDNTELLPGGGLIGVYGLVTFEEGRLRERSFSEADEIIDRWQQRSGGEYIEPPAPLKRYLLRDWTWNFSLANWSPDFPTAARQALFFYDRAGSEPVDGVIGIDFPTLEGLLGVVGPRPVAGYGVTVDASNVTEQTLTHIRDIGRPDDSHAFATAVAVAVVDATLAVDQERWDSLLETLDRLAGQKHLFLYAEEPRLQDAVRRLGWAGEVKEAAGDYLMAVNASVQSTKLNLVLQERMAVKVSLDGEGNARHTVDLHYENRLAEWASGRDPGLVERLMASGFYGGYIRILAPAQARLMDLRLNGGPVGVEDLTYELGKASFGRYIPLTQGAHADLRFVYDVPAVADVDGGAGEYRLLIQKQPGVGAVPLSVDLRLPAGARAREVLLDGQRLDATPLLIETDLSWDRELVVRYR